MAVVCRARNFRIFRTTRNPGEEESERVLDSGGETGVRWINLLWHRHRWDDRCEVNFRMTWIWIRTARIAAWAALIVATGYLVKAEAQRPELPDGVEAHRDILYRSEGDRPSRLDVYLPKTAPPKGGWPALVAVHGGGWRGGSKTGYGKMAARFAQHGYVVVAVDYRLSRPGAPSWPGNFDDVREAVRWLRRHAADYHVDPNRIAAMGASAGGHLVALLGTYPDLPVAKDGLPRTVEPLPADATSARVQAVVDFYGPTDLRVLAGGRARAGGPVALFLGGTIDEFPGRYEAASPVSHVSRDDPPVLLIHGTDDALVPLDQSRRLVSALEGAGVPNRLIVVEGAKHGFGLAVAERDLLPEILAFLDKVWNPSSPSKGR